MQHRPTEARSYPVSLNELRALLAAHSGFRTLSVKQNPTPSQSALKFGRLIKRIRLLKFGAEFDNSFTLLWHKLHVGPGMIILDLFWHVTHLPGNWYVFLHFVDEGGETHWQADYSLSGAAPSPFGFLYSRRRIELPAGAPSGKYHIRLGVWSPQEGRHIPLTRLRGCARESAEWGNAVRLEFFTNLKS
jgi:hypothetical protein